MSLSFDLTAKLTGSHRIVALGEASTTGLSEESTFRSIVLLFDCPKLSVAVNVT